MKNSLKNKLILSAIATLAMSYSASSLAAGTIAGTTINNQATLGFSVGGVAQANIDSNTVSFVVDNRTNATLIANNGGVATNVAPGGSGYVHRYTLTNTGNSVQDFALAVNSTGFNGQTLYTRTDNFDVAGCIVRVDGNANGTYEVANDTLAYADELAADASVAVFTICNTPAGRINNDFSIVSLSARVAQGGTAATQGANLTQTAGADTAGTVDIVFGDLAGTDDIVRDGIISVRGGYVVAAPNLTVTKSSVAICDGLNFNSNPKAIPGGYVRYTINIANAPTAGASASLGTLTDNLDTTNLVFDANLIAPAAASCATPESAAGNSFKITCTGGTRACVATPSFRTGAADTDGVSFATGTITSNFNTVLGVETGYTAGELKAGESVNLIFNVRIN